MEITKCSEILTLLIEWQTFLNSIMKLRNLNLGPASWNMPVIPATQMAEMEGWECRSTTAKKLIRLSLNKKAGHSSICL
jgi:hypothetical protein